jgi:hypothetical protein
MAPRLLPIAVLTALISTLAGCSNYERPRRPAWRSQAENACLAQNLIRVSDFVQPVREIDGPGICGLTRPFRVSALLDGAVRLNSNSVLDCPMIAALNGWISAVVQPAALARFGQPVAQIDSMGAYSCRSMNNQRGARISEHAFGNALDIGGFRLADGREILIVRDWTRGDDQARAFLQDVHAGGCAHFTTVLGPGANVFHYNHIHFDLAMHGNSSSGPRRICRPAPQFAPAPPAPRDGLPDAPEFDDDVDVAQGRLPADGAAMAHAGPGPAPIASVPTVYAVRPAASPAAIARAPIPPEPVGGSLREDGAFVPEGNPRDWDLTSSIPRR